MKVISLIFFILITSCASRKVKVDHQRDPILAKHERYSQCYYESDAYTQKLVQTVNLAYSITADGKISQPKILEQGVKDPNFSTCFVTIIKQVQFNPKKVQVGKEFTQAFTFYPKIIE